MSWWERQLATILTPRDWTPTYSAGGSMTFTSVTTTRARYVRIFSWVFFYLNFIGTTGGTADNDIFIDGLPVTAATTLIPFACLVTDGITTGGVAWLSTTTQINVRKADATDFGLGAGRAIRIFGIYEAA